MAQSGLPIGGIGGVSGNGAIDRSDPFAGIEQGTGPAMEALGVQQNVRGHSNLMAMVSGLLDVANRTLKDLLKNF